jgi:hypothetical protein
MYWKSLILVALLVLGKQANCQDGIRIFTADYENVQLDSGVTGLIAGNPTALDAFEISCKIARRGRCSIVSGTR